MAKAPPNPVLTRVSEPWSKRRRPWVLATTMNDLYRDVVARYHVGGRQRFIAQCAQGIGMQPCRAAELLARMQASEQFDELYQDGLTVAALKVELTNMESEASQWRQRLGVRVRGRHGRIIRVIPPEIAINRVDEEGVLDVLVEYALDYPCDNGDQSVTEAARAVCVRKEFHNHIDRCAQVLSAFCDCGGLVQVFVEIERAFLTRDESVDQLFEAYTSFMCQFLLAQQIPRVDAQFLIALVTELFGDTAFTRELCAGAIEREDIESGREPRGRFPATDEQP